MAVLIIHQRGNLVVQTVTNIKVLLNFLLRFCITLYITIPGKLLGKTAFVFLAELIYSQNSDFVFEHFSVEHGLSSANVGAIYQDRTGYIWFGAYNGVDRYDGYGFTSYKYPGDSVILRNEFPGSICEDDEGNIWIASHSGGIEKLNPKTNTFTNYLPEPQQPKNDWSNFVLSIYADKNNVMWVGTGNGFYRFNNSNQSFTAFEPDENDPYSLGHHSVNAIYEDRSGTLWLATGGGLDRFDREANKFYHYWHYPNNGWGERETAMFWVLSILEDNSEIIWLGTDEGLVEFDRKTEKFVRHVYRHNNSIIRPNNIILSICEVGSSNLWLATQGGLAVFNKSSKKFSYQVYDEKNINGLSGNLLKSILKDKSGSVWISTTLGGVNKIDLPDTFFEKYLFDPLKDESIASDNILSLYESDDRKIWIATTKGLDRFDIKTRKFTGKPLYSEFSAVFQDCEGNILVSPNIGGLYKLTDKNKWLSYIDSTDGSYSDRFVSFHQTKRDHFWIGNLTGNLYLFDELTHQRKRVANINNAVNVICEDSFGLVWFGGIATGLFCFNTKQDTVFQFSSKLNEKSSLNDNSIIAIFEDHSANLWVGTNKGLNLYNSEANTFTRFSGKDDFFADGVRQILEDDAGNLWISTRDGMAKFNPITKQSVNYYSSSQFSGIEFLSQVGCRTKDGYLYFGGRKGFIRFNPDSVKENPFVPPIVITSFRKFERPFPFGSGVELSHKDNFISFEFAALSYVNSKENQYAYMMEGVDNDWIYCGTRRYASYPNIEPGEYIFRVKGSTSNRIWNEAGTTLRIKINPPWWNTNWAYFLFFLLILTIIYFTWKMQVNKIKMKHVYEMSRFEAQKLHEVDEIKSRFFTNISHEFRTPITLIMGPSKQILQKSNDEKIKTEADLIHRSAIKLNRLVDELLDISKIESGEMKLKACPVNLVSVVKGTALSFQSLAERKKIKFKLSTDEEEIITYIDRDKFDKILNNVLSNAFKFTPEGGKVEVIISCQAELVSASLANSKIPKQVRNEGYGFAEITIRDTGIGIPKNQLDKIFDRFYQVDGSHTRMYGGSGIGLSLTKELIALHKGRIEVESEEGKGTTFRLLFPLGKSHLSKEEICEEEKCGKVDQDKDEDKDKDELSLLLEQRIRSKNFASENYEIEAVPTLLIVEDNPDVRKYISMILENQYSIIEAADGEEGLNKSFECIPNIIISDIMMPKMDGFVMCYKLKTDSRTSHIPIIMLTAKATIENKISGLEIGADDYIIKPFEADELKARIKNLLEQRKRLHEHFRQHGLLELDEKNITPIDKKFLEKCIEVINKHIADTSFGVEVLAENMLVSRSVLLKKIEALIGESPIELIKRIRLHSAAKLIEKNFGNVSQIALEVGFNNPSYFAECFKKQFGVSPSQFHSSNKKYR